MDLFEGITEVGWNSFLELLRILVLHKVLIHFESFLQNARQICLYVCTDLVSVHTVTITDHKQVETLLVTHVWSQSVRVLINLVRVAWLVTTRSRKGKFGDRIESLFHLLYDHWFDLLHWSYWFVYILAVLDLWCTLLIQIAFILRISIFNNLLLTFILFLLFDLMVFQVLLRMLLLQILETWSALFLN